MNSPTKPTPGQIVISVPGATIVVIPDLAQPQPARINGGGSSYEPSDRMGRALLELAKQNTQTLGVVQGLKESLESLERDVSDLRAELHVDDAATKFRLTQLEAAVRQLNAGKN